MTPISIKLDKDTRSRVEAVRVAAAKQEGRVPSLTAVLRMLVVEALDARGARRLKAR